MFLPILPGLTAMTQTDTAEPKDPTPQTAQTAEPAHLLELFHQLVPPEVLNSLYAVKASLFTPWLILWLMVWQRTQGNATLSDAVAELALGPTSDALPDCKRTREQNISVNTSAYSQARSRLPVEAAEQAADRVFTSLTRDLAPAYKGRPAYLVDGSSVSLDHHPELVEAFPPAVNQHGSSHWPVIRLVTAHELATGLSPRWEYGPMYGPEATSETALAKELLKRLPAPSLIVYDRNFGIFSMTYAAVQAGHEVVARMTDSRFRAVTGRMERTGSNEWLGWWHPSREERQHNPELPDEAAVYGRFVEIRIEHQGREVVLLLFTTDLTATHAELAALYRQRWDIETDIRDVKIALNMHKITGRGVEMVAKEIALGVVAYNLTVQVRRLAAEQAGIPPRQLSFRRTLGLVQAFARGVVGCTAEQCAARFERLLKAVAQCRLPHRPDRNYARELIPRRRGYPERKRNQVVDKKS
jgi:hypothetical protein